MDKMRAQGVVFGNPAIRTDVQPQESAAWSKSAGDLVRRIADVLREFDDPQALTRSEVARILNERGIRSGHDNEWNAFRVTAPLRKARELLRQQDQEALQSQPTFGMF
ncbi:hypothetical protein [Tropicimonas aquimaris]|uniref:Recombinase domain-containing protein n=1 Tax=Tropicimonas aquimaris TaxID=914152 RepID=A0ABW3IR12_9RHOB